MASDLGPSCIYRQGGTVEVGKVSVVLPCMQELETLSAKLESEKKAIEEAAKNLREEKDTADQ